MRIGILTWNKEGWCSKQLIQAVHRKNLEAVTLNFRQLTARIKGRPLVSFDGRDPVEDLDALIVRPIGRGSLEEIIFRMDLLRRLERAGLLVINPPAAIEHSVDKYYTLTVFEEAGLPVPRTIVTESYNLALEAFHELGGDVIVKPLFGSRGIGVTRVTDSEVAARIFRSLDFHHEVLYLQEFISHGSSDIRAFVIGDRVVASERRRSTNWKANISLGAKPEPHKLNKEMEELVVKASQIIGCRISGVDILERPEGPVLVELNSQPGWRGLQSVTEKNIAEEIVEYILSELRH